jgi:hypothetical protein
VVIPFWPPFADRREDAKVVGIVSRFDFRGIELDRLDEQTGLWERI